MKLLRKLGFLSIILLLISCGQQSLEEKKADAHRMYKKAMAGEGYQVSDLPRGEGKTRGDDYRHCLVSGYAKGADDEEEFCRWHAGIGTWSLYHSNYPSWKKANPRPPSSRPDYGSDEYQYEKDCIGILSYARDLYERKDPDLFRSLTDTQNEFFLKRPSGYFPSKHIETSKFLHKQRMGERGNTYLVKTLESCGFAENISQQNTSALVICAGEDKRTDP